MTGCGKDQWVAYSLSGQAKYILIEEGGMEVAHNGENRSGQ